MHTPGYTNLSGVVILLLGVGETHDCSIAHTRNADCSSGSEVCSYKYTVMLTIESRFRLVTCTQFGLQDGSEQDHHVRGPQPEREVCAVSDSQPGNHGEHAGKPDVLQQAPGTERLHHLRRVLVLIYS